MKRNLGNIEGRIALTQMILNTPDKGIEYLERAIETLKSCKTSEDRVRFLAELLFLSERTIANDLAA